MSTIPYPLAPLAVSGNNVTVDLMLKEPTRITRFLSDMTLRGYFADKIFPNAGGVEGGALLYTQLTENQLFTQREVQNVEPGGEFPVVTFARPTPRTAQVEKFGGKFPVTDEAARRNDDRQMVQGSTALANTINRKIHTRALAELDAEFTALGGSAQTATGNNWGTVVTGGSSQATASAWPAADFAKVQLLADTKELGVQFDTWILNPVQATAFKTVYGNAWQSVLEDWGIENFISTNRVTAGTAWVLAEGEVGEMRLEKPLATETWRDPENETSWVQSSVLPVFVVTNPYSIAKVTGLGG